MKTPKLLIYILMPAMLMAFSTACSDDDLGEDPDKNNIPNVCEDGAEFCVQYGNLSLNGDADLNEVDLNHYEIIFENPTGNFEVINIHIYGSSKGTYLIDTTDNPGSASLSFFSGQGGGLVRATDGSLDLTSFQPDDAGISGDFNATMEDGTVVTDGHFIKVQKD